MPEQANQIPMSSAADHDRIFIPVVPKPKKPRAIHKSESFTIYYRKNMRKVDNSWTANWDQWAYA